MKKSPVIYEWIGQNEFVPGLPARNIPEQEAKSLGMLDLIEQSGKYIIKREAKSDRTGKKERNDVS
jgi:hypothetical protein